MAKIRIVLVQYEDEWNERGYRSDKNAVELLTASFEATAEGCERLLSIASTVLLGRKVSNGS